MDDNVFFVDSSPDKINWTCSRQNIHSGSHEYIHPIQIWNIYETVRC